MAPDSLVDMARRVCGRNIRNLQSIGGLRPELIKPLLTKIENPDQLHALEVNSPSVVGHTKEAWISLLKRNIPNLESRLPENWQTTLFAEENAERWHMIYKKLRRQVAKETAALDNRLAQQLAESNSKVAASVIDRPPGSVVRVGKNKYAAAAAAYTTNLYKAGKPGGPSFFERVRASDQRRKAARMATPTHLLNRRVVSGVTKAPAGLVEELREKKAIQAEQLELERKQREQKIRAERGEIVARPPKAMGSTSFKMDTGDRVVKQAKPPLHGGNYDLTKDREDRLRALKAGKAAPPKPSLHEIAKLTADFLEDDEDDDHSDGVHQSAQILDDEDLFDERPKKKPQYSPEKQARDSLKPAVRTTSSTIAERERKAVPSPAPSSNLGPIIRKRKGPPTLFRPNKR